MRRQFPDVPVLGLTATATSNVIQDVRKMLQLPDCLLFRASFNRTNLYYEVSTTSWLPCVPCLLQPHQSLLWGQYHFLIALCSVPPSTALISIMRSVPLPDCLVFRASFNRTNLYYEVSTTSWLPRVPCLLQPHQSLLWGQYHFLIASCSVPPSTAPISIMRSVPLPDCLVFRASFNRTNLYYEVSTTSWLPRVPCLLQPHQSLLWGQYHFLIASCSVPPSTAPISIMRSVPLPDCLVFCASFSRTNLYYEVSTTSVFEPGRDSATLSRSLFECRTKINHPRHQVANKYQMSHIWNRYASSATKLVTDLSQWLLV